jgi:hypothetical protein
VSLEPSENLWRASNIPLDVDSATRSGGQGFESSNLGYFETRNPKR